jgi:hypothetical protein
MGSHMINGPMHAVHVALERGDEKAALKLLEVERERARNRKDVAALAALLPLAREGQARASDRRRGPWERVVYAIEQNMAFLARASPARYQPTVSARGDSKPDSTTSLQSSTEEILGEYLKSLASPDDGAAPEIDDVADGPLPRQVTEPTTGPDRTSRPEVKRSNEPLHLAPVDPIDLIRRLAELRAAGVLTDEEFVQKKTEILGRL